MGRQCGERRDQRDHEKRRRHAGRLVDAKLGDFEQRGAGRWGGKLGDLGSYRVYALGFGEGHTRLPNGDSAMDDWRGKQAGFRSDLSALDSTFTVQGDIYENLSIRRPGDAAEGTCSAAGTNDSRTARRYRCRPTTISRTAPIWHSPAAASAEQLEDDRRRGASTHSRWGRHQIVWGAGQRNWVDRFVNTANPFVLVPESQTLSLTNVFGQDTIALRNDLKLILGTKFEYSSFSGSAVMPNARLGWDVDPRNFLWAAISRAVRSPSRLERDLTAPGIVNTSPDFQSEKLDRVRGRLALATARARDIVGIAVLQRLHRSADHVARAGHHTSGHVRQRVGRPTYGVDAWASYSPLSWWRINPGFGLLRKDFHLKPGEQDIAGVQTVLGHDPGHQVFLRSYMDLPHDIELYVGLRQIASLSEVDVPSYFEADVRLGWHVTPDARALARRDSISCTRGMPKRRPPDPANSAQRLPGARWTSERSSASPHGASHRRCGLVAHRRVRVGTRPGARIAQARTVEHAVKATYLYKFAPFVEWPAGASESRRIRS